jgi:hypothetical protein
MGTIDTARRHRRLLGVRSDGGQDGENGKQKQAAHGK